MPPGLRTLLRPGPRAGLGGWTDPKGRRRGKACGAGELGKKTAERLRDKRHAELVTDTYQAAVNYPPNLFTTQKTTKNRNSDAARLS
jgi:hypothetical protein